MDNFRKNNKTIMFPIIGIMVMILAVVGVSIAFFNYTRTGVANNIGTGRIYFNSVQGNTLNINNMFPLKSSEAESQIASLSGVTLQVEGDTTYDEGEEFEVTLTNLNNTINGKQIPIKYIATYTANTDASIGEESDTYWTSRYSKDSNIYTLTETGTVSNGKQVLVGYIKKGNTGIDGTLTIKAYIDGDKIAISDTYDGTESDDMGTTNEWVNGRTVLTTTEWNSLNSTGISFQIRAESNEGIWVEEQDNSTPASCFTTETTKVYKHNTNMTNEEINVCVSYFTNQWGPEEEGNTVDVGETYEDFCRGTGTNWGETFQDILNNGGFDPARLYYFEEHNIINNLGYTTTITNYDASCGSEVIIPSTINIEQVSYTRNPDMNINTCVSKFTEFGFNERLQEGETFEAFCNGTGTVNGMTLQEVLNMGDEGFGIENLRELESVGIITKEVTGTVNASVTTIGNSAFEGKGLTNVTIPNSVTTIVARAFSSNSIEGILVIPDSVNYIGVNVYNPGSLPGGAFINNNITQIIVSDAYFDNNSSHMCDNGTIVQTASYNSDVGQLDYLYNEDNTKILVRRLSANVLNIVDKGVRITNRTGNKYCSAAIVWQE